MPSKPQPGERKRVYCDHAIDAIDSILQYVDGMDHTAFENDRKTVSAVERELFIIAEVIARLGDFEESYARGYQVRGFANRLRHEYDRVDKDVLWDVVTGGDLSELRSAFDAYRSSL